MGSIADNQGSEMARQSHLWPKLVMIREVNAKRLAAGGLDLYPKPIVAG